MNQLLKKSLLPIVIIALLALLGLQLTKKPQAPDVTFSTLDGRQISMASLKDKVVIVNFWATDCPGCIKEMPDLIKTYHTYQPKGLEIIAIAMPHDEISQIKNYSKAQNLPFPVMYDQQAEMTELFGKVRLTPTAFIYNKQGDLLQRTIGELDFSALQQLLNKELGV
ncbi:MAG: thioredoxin [Methylotenera sp.]|jgi:thiol-disulfide isomerase/thioredoxin|uniref:peroxiredoxin family protein n=1 Tax=Methylotenera sp. TaxID=2051956 RepID=UPI000D473C46|nr:TlpA disulfide reductase family protein [Methylotenera sp.]MDP3210914.1 TlpA disulfide reductase family protein [Methylotenera sp.]MDP3778241.1 TlpA disulfide reductase family protein [Methylotenera sp.]PPC89208.1 MAG: thioredoxin [Methylotenera sp.]